MGNLVAHEKWKDIQGFEGFYQISNFGRIRSVDRFVKSRHGQRVVKGKVLSPSKNKRTGYYQIHLYKFGCCYRYNVHSLVAKAFVPLNGKPYVNHKDGQKENNRADNLEWVTNAENHYHAVRLGLNKNYGANSYKARTVIQLDQEGNLIKKWECINDASYNLGIHQSNIVKCCNGERKTTGGFMWKYEEVTMP
jgi:hypothetical protein